jgi:hypothetical protein
MSFQDYWGLFGSAVLIPALVFSLPWLRRWKGIRCLLAGLLFACMLLPLGNGLSLAGYIRGFIGDLSVTTLVLILGSFFFPSAADAEPRRTLLVIVLAGGLVLYTLSLGPFRIDPYGWGYHPRMLLLALAIAGVQLARQHVMGPYYLAVPLLAYALNISASTNLWDYLIDPLVFVYAFCCLLIRPVLGLCTSRVIRRPLHG